MECVHSKSAEWFDLWLRVLPGCIVHPLGCLGAGRLSCCDAAALAQKMGPCLSLSSLCCDAAWCFWSGSYNRCNLWAFEKHPGPVPLLGLSVEFWKCR